MKAKPLLALFLSGLFALVGTLFATASYSSWQSIQQISETGIETKGIVTGLRYGRNKKGHQTTTLAPVVEFITTQGKPITYYSNSYTTPAEFAVGDTIRLWYLPTNPQKVVTLEGTDRWILPAIFGLFGVVFSLIGYPLLISTVRKTILGGT